MPAGGKVLVHVVEEGSAAFRFPAMDHMEKGPATAACWSPCCLGMAHMRRSESNVPFTGAEKKHHLIERRDSQARQAWRIISSQDALSACIDGRIPKATP